MAKGDDELTNKLIMLFVFDQMDIALTERVILDICYSANNWIMPLYCIDTLNRLLKSNFIHKSKHGQDVLYTLTPDGRACLANFYKKLPESLRHEIIEYVKENRMDYKRKQEYSHTYFKNSDGTYTVWLRIIEPTSTLFDLKLIVPNVSTAKHIHLSWEQKAANVYLSVHNQLVDD